MNPTIRAILITIAIFLLGPTVIALGWMLTTLILAREVLK